MSRVWNEDKCRLFRPCVAELAREGKMGPVDRPVPAAFCTPEVYSDHELVEFNLGPAFMFALSGEPSVRVLSYNVCERWREIVKPKDGSGSGETIRFFNNPYGKTEVMEQALARQKRCLDRIERALRPPFHNQVEAVALQEINNCAAVQTFFATRGWQVFGLPAATVLEGSTAAAAAAATTTTTGEAAAEGDSRVLLAINNQRASVWPTPPAGPLLGNGQTVAAVSRDTLYVAVHLKWIHKDNSERIAQLAKEMRDFCLQVQSEELQKARRSVTSATPVNMFGMYEYTGVTNIVFVGDFNMEDYSLPDTRLTVDIHEFVKMLDSDEWMDEPTLFTTGDYTNARVENGEQLCTTSDYAIRIIIVNDTFF